MTYWKNLFSTGFRDSKGALAITDSQQSTIVSILSAGTFFGALAAAPFGDLLGRRLALVVSAGIVFVLGVILQTAAEAIPTFVAGRFFAGFGVGLISALVPLYQSETAPKWIRGTIVGSYQLAITIGLLIAAIVDNATKDRNDTGSYRIPVAIQFAWAIILVVGMLILPETPRYRIRQGRMEDAAKALHRLRRLPIDHPALIEELAEIKANNDYELTLGRGTYLDCFKGTLGKRLLTGCGLQALQQLTGVNFIFYYGTQFFLNSGFTNPFIITMITNVVNVLSTFPGLYLVEAWGRRPLLLFGAVGMCVCQFIVAATGTALPNDPAANKALIAFVCIYIFFFACSWGPVAWVVTGELFPLKVRAKSLSMTTATNWLLNWAIAYMTPYLVNEEHANLKAKVFFIWGSCCFICIAFVYLMIYETKGLSLEQVDEMYSKVSKAWESSKFVPTVNYKEIEQSHVDSRRATLAEIQETVARRKSTQVGTAGGDHEYYEKTAV